jgi:hypothetical protein
MIFSRRGLAQELSSDRRDSPAAAIHDFETPSPINHHRAKGEQMGARSARDARTARKCLGPRNSIPDVALMTVDKFMETRHANHQNSCVRRRGGGLSPPVAPCERRGSMRPKLCRAPLRRKLHA